MYTKHLLQPVLMRRTPGGFVAGSRLAAALGVFITAIFLTLQFSAPATPGYANPPDDGFNPGADGEVKSVAVQPDGKILVGGWFYNLGGQPRNRIGRLNPDGTLDTTFNPGADAGVQAMAVQTNGRILVGGQFATLGGLPRVRIGRLNADGSPDTAFNPGARGTNSDVEALAVQTDGKILMGGSFTTVGGQTRNNIARLNADGSVDAAFNADTDFDVWDLAVQKDGKIVVGGNFGTLDGQPRRGIGRLNADGTMDTTFNNLGTSAFGSVRVLALQADGKILVGGSFTTLGGQPRSNIARLNADGTVDATFDPGASGGVNALAVRPDGKIVVGGFFTTLSGQARANIGRLNADGTPDMAFDPGADSLVNAVAMQTDGKLLVGGYFNALGGKPRKNIGRLNADPVKAALAVEIRGPRTFVPGRVEEYAIIYSNGTLEAVQNAVLRVALPSYADYLDNSGGGIVWPQRRQLFWKLGSLAPGSSGLVSFRVRFIWGIPVGTKDTAVADLGGTGLDPAGFNVQPYLVYTPTTIVSERQLNSNDVQAERQLYSELDQLYSQAVQEGFALGVANSMTFNTGEPMTEIVLLRFDPSFGAMFLRRQGNLAQATRVDSTSYIVRTPRGALSYNFQTDNWETVAAGASTGSLSREVQGATFSDCFYNCTIELVPKFVIKNVFKSASVVSKAADCYKAATGRDELDIAKCAQIVKKIPGVSEGIDLGRCNADCQGNPDSHRCTEDKYFCDSGDFPYGWFGIDVKKRCTCITDPLTGREGQYMACETYQVCAVCEKCVDNDGSPSCRIPSSTVQSIGSASARLAAVAGGSSGDCSRCVAAKDPNAKYGPEGDVFPGQTVTYTITFENEGAGEAFGVFVTDVLAEHLITSTLTIFGGGEFSSASNTLTWVVGDLAPKGQMGSTGAVSFTVRLKPDLAAGTVVLNQAVVHFPSVPEDTPTNTVVNVVQPLAAIPQGVETVAGQTVAIRLQGRSAGGASLTYGVTEQPQNGELSGAPPDLTYTPAAGFTGLDRLRFTVSDGATTSRSDEVQIQVLPSPGDTTPPQILRTSPQNGATIPRIVTTPLITDTAGPLYVPNVRIEFSEAISATTVTASTIGMTDSSGRALPIRVTYDGTANQALILLREPPRYGTQYTVTVTTGAKDLMGNSLAADYVSTFRTGGSTTYLPFLSR